MRKRTIGQDAAEPSAADSWLDLEALAVAEIGSEEEGFPLEAALRPGDRGWRAAQAGEQVIRFVFDEPRRIRRIRLIFEEVRTARTQEFFLAWSGAGAAAPREIVRQQYTFHPPQNSRQSEDYSVDLNGVKSLELRIRPEIGGGEARASLGLIQIA